MSLAIIKVDKESKQHSVYSDGRVSKGTEIILENSPKIFKYDLEYITTCKCNVSVLGASIGSMYLDKFIDSFLKDELSGIESLWDISRDIPRVVEDLTEAYNKLWQKYCLHRNIPVNSTRYASYEGLLSINGYLFHIDSYDLDDNVVFQVYYLDKGYDIIGAGKPLALPLLEYGVTDMQKVFDIVSSKEASVNANVFLYEGVSYSDED